MKKPIFEAYKQYKKDESLVLLLENLLHVDGCKKEVFTTFNEYYTANENLFISHNGFVVYDY